VGSLSRSNAAWASRIMAVGRMFRNVPRRHYEVCIGRIVGNPVDVVIPDALATVLGSRRIRKNTQTENAPFQVEPTQNDPIALTRVESRLPTVEPTLIFMSLSCQH
jgi:hypothetical protein